MARDKEKRREYKKNWQKNKYDTDPEYRKDQVARSKKGNKTYAVKVKALITEFRQSGCKACDEKNHDCLCAHHRDPKDKEFSISALSKIKIAIDRVKDELKKCDCLCLNCHAKLHAKMRRETDA